MTINFELIKTAIQTAQEIFSQQTADDLAAIKDHFGKAYNEANIIAEIAVKLVLRVGNISTVSDGRALSPVDALVFDAEKAYHARYGG